MGLALVFGAENSFYAARDRMVRMTWFTVRGSGDEQRTVEDQADGFSRSLEKGQKKVSQKYHQLIPR